jgi:hypothetical protein
MDPEVVERYLKCSPVLISRSIAEWCSETNWTLGIFDSTRRVLDCGTIGIFLRRVECKIGERLTEDAS